MSIYINYIWYAPSLGALLLIYEPSTCYILGSYGKLKGCPSRSPTENFFEQTCLHYDLSTFMF